jgi:hypothetical protein
MSRPHRYKEPPFGSWHPDYGSFTGHPMDPRTDPDAGLQPCLECDAKGEQDDDEPCPFCDGKGYFLDETPMTPDEYERFCDDLRAPA